MRCSPPLAAGWRATADAQRDRYPQAHHTTAFLVDSGAERMTLFAWPWAAAALLLPLLVLLLPVAGDRGGEALRAPFFAAAHGWTVAGGRARGVRRVPWLALIAYLLLVVASMRPQVLEENLGVPASGRDLMLAVDLSGSMREQDMVSGSQVQSRLDAVKRIAGDFIERRQGDRIGLVLFGTRAYLQAPLSYDGATVRALLEESEIGLAGEQTAIGDAIGLAVKRLRDHSLEERVLVLLTDGSNTAGELQPLAAARLAGELGLRIHTIGVGADSQDFRRLLGLQGLLQQRAPELDERTLQSIAKITGGSYFRARDQDELEQVYAALDELEPLPSDDLHGRPVTELYPWPLAAALLLALTRAALTLLGDWRRGTGRAGEVAGS